MNASSPDIDAINDLAHSEGWAIFNECEIQKDDDFDSFDGDDAAIAHVERMAASGSRWHAKAIEIHFSSTAIAMRSLLRS